MADKALTAEQQAEQQEDADFEAGAAMETEAVAAAVTEPPKEEPKPEAKPEAKPAAQADATPPPAPEYVQITRQQFEGLNKAVEKVATFEQQFSKVFGTLGDVQKIVKTMQAATPRGTKVEIPKEAFAGLEKEFPELAGHIRAAMEGTLKGVTGTGSAEAEVDPAKIEKLVSASVIKAESEALEDAYPNWKTIVGAVDLSKEKPNPDHPFRKWLATKDAAYQAKINGTNSAQVIARAIRQFQTDSKAPPQATAPVNGSKATARADRIKSAVQPRGDGGPPAQRKEDDEFEAGFKAG